jgi:hypothetical protein
MKERCRQDNSGACATCPFVKANFGKANPDGFDPKQAERKHGRKFFDWYSDKNLRRLWKGGISMGEVMICHATDPNADEYGGKAAARGNERPCIGALAIVFQHLKYIEGLIEGGSQPAETMKLYRAAAGKMPLTTEGAFAWTMMMNRGGTELTGGMPIPASLSPKTIRECGVPWQDGIVGMEGEARDDATDA